MLELSIIGLRSQAHHPRPFVQPRGTRHCAFSPLDELIPALEWLFICDLTLHGEREGGRSEEGPHPLSSN
jgi:hypothetical protein